MHPIPLLLLASLLLAGCASAVAQSPVPRATPAGEWQSAHGRDHELVGKIWDVAAGQFIAPATLEARLARARFVLLGERHDSPDHHRLQARLVEAMIAAGRRPAVGFEMLATDEAPVIAQYLAGHPRDAAGLGPAVGWDKSGWPDWKLYQPIADAAVRAGLPIVATNLDRQATRAVRTDGLAALGPDLVARLGLDLPLDPVTRQEMADEIRDAHCGHAPGDMIAPMINVQRARDAEMAATLAQAGRADGAVQITGAGHVRKDRAIPAYLTRLVDGASIASVIFYEVVDGRTDPRAYPLRAERDGSILYDYAWFTPRWDESDPCEEFKAALQRLREPVTKERSSAPESP